MRRLRLFPVLLLSAASLAASESYELPEPDLQHLDEEIRVQLREGRDRLEALTASESTSAARLAAAYGELGQLYYLYDLPGAAEAAFLNARALAPDDFRWHYFLGILFAQEGRPEDTVTSLERVLDLHPEDVAARVRLGDALMELDRAEEAAGRYVEALERQPDSAAAQYGLGRALSDRGDLEGAVERFEAALRLQPEATSIHHSLGMTYRRLGRLEEARRHLALNRGDRVRLADPLVEGLAARLASGGQMQFKAAVEALKRGEVEVAIRRFGLALEENPDDYLIHYNLALAHLKRGSRDRAEEALRRAVAIEPDFRNGHFNLATLLAEQGRLEEAEHHFGRAHEVDPLDGVAHLEWATALSRLGRLEEAASELGKLLEAEPGNARATLNLGLLEAQLGRRRAAIATLERATGLDAQPADRATALLRLGALLEEAGERGRAIDRYRTAVELAPQSLDSRYALARALGREGRFAEAAERFAEIVERHPEELEAHFGRAMARVLGEQYPRALAELESSLAERPASVPLRHLLARLLATSPDPAVRDGERGLRLARQTFEAARTLEHAETVAMALAELGRFEEAASWQSRVVTEAERAGASTVAEAARRRLDLYRRGEPCRAPWNSG